MSVIKLAANAFGSPSITFCQLAKERHENTAHSKRVVASAAHFAKPNPLPSSRPQIAERPPKTEPEIRAVFAAAGLER